jgi:hypothetical protein
LPLTGVQRDERGMNVRRNEAQILLTASARLRARERLMQILRRGD